LAQPPPRSQGTETQGNRQSPPVSRNRRVGGWWLERKVGPHGFHPV
jgi:hypothetical protein